MSANNCIWTIFWSCERGEGMALIEIAETGWYFFATFSNQCLCPIELCGGKDVDDDVDCWLESVRCPLPSASLLFWLRGDDPHIFYSVAIATTINLHSKFIVTMNIVCKQFYKAVRLLFMFPLYINRFLLPAVSACPNPGAPLGLIISSRVFRFTSKLEFRFEAWGAHTDRYDKATDPKKNGVQ